MSRVRPAIIPGSLFALVLAACASVPRGFEVAPDESLVHLASGTIFPRTVASFTRGTSATYNAEATDISVQYFQAGAGGPALDMYVFPACNAEGPIGLIRQHVDFCASIGQLHPGAVAESDVDVYVMQGGVRHRAAQATFTYPAGPYSFGRRLYSMLVEFEFEGWFISYRMDIPNDRRSEARALLRDFIAAASLPVLPCERTAQGFAGTVKTGSAEDIRAAIAGGAKVNGRGADGLTFLMSAAMHNPDAGVIAALIDAGADPAARMESGETALMYAAMSNGNPDVIRALLESGVDIEARSANGVTALIFAAGYNLMPSIVATLLDAGADPEARAGNGATALMAASWRNPDAGVAAELLAAGADVRAADNGGHTALMWAAMYNETPEVILELLDAGAVLGATDRTGKTAADYLAANIGLRGTEAWRRLTGDSR